MNTPVLLECDAVQIGV